MLSEESGHHQRGLQFRKRRLWLLNMCKVKHFSNQLNKLSRSLGGKWKRGTFQSGNHFMPSKNLILLFIVELTSCIKNILVHNHVWIDTFSLHSNICHIKRMIDRTLQVIYGGVWIWLIRHFFLEMVIIFGWSDICQELDSLSWHGLTNILTCVSSALTLTLLHSE